MPVLHLVTDSVAPQPGGMQESVRRIAQGLAAQGNEVHIHTLKQAPEYRTPPGLEGGITIHDLGARSGDLLDPFGEGSAPESEETRIRYVTLRNQIAQLQRRGGRHILISFYASGAGFLAQHAAASLGLPHVASFRGTDYGRDLLAAATHAKIRFVAENAARIVTTNHEQAAGLTAMFPVRHPVRAIYNSIGELDQRPVWKSAPSASVRFVSDSGLSSRKATHLLLRAFAHVIDRGLPVSLTVFGGVFAKDPPEYWRRCREAYEARYPGRISFPGHLPASQIDAHLLEAGAYCSASLSEGCSLSHIRALTIGIPIAATACGALPEVASGCDHVWLCPPGDPDAFAAMLETAAARMLSGEVTPDAACVERWRVCFSAEREREQWRSVIEGLSG